MSEVMGTFVGGRYGVARRGPETAQKIAFKEAYQVNYVVAGTPYTDDLPTIPVWATDQASADAVDLTLDVYILYSVPLLGAGGPATLKLVTVTDYAALAALSDVIPLFLLHSSREQIYQAGSLGGGGGGALVIEHGGSVVASEPALNFIDGTGIVLTVADNPGSSRVDVTIDATTSSGFTWILKTANYAMSSADSGILVDATAGNVVITLPGVLHADKLLAIKRIDDVLAHTVTVNTGGAPTIDDGSTAFLVRQYHGYVIGSDNNNWWLHSFFFPNPLTALGALAAGDAAGVPTERTVGADGDVLTADSGDPVGVSYGAGGGGGSSTLAGLTDVTLTSPTNGEVLTYDAGTGKWIDAAGGGGGGGGIIFQVQNTRLTTDFGPTAGADPALVTITGTGATLTMTLVGGTTVRIDISGGASGTATGPSFWIIVDGTTSYYVSESYFNGSFGIMVGSTIITGLAAGSHTFAVAYDCGAARNVGVLAASNPVGEGLLIIGTEYDNAGGGGGGGGLFSAYLCYQDQEAAGTDGGTFTAGSWQTRVLNTEVADTGLHGSLAANQVTLDAGTYMVRAEAPVYRAGHHQLRVQNITDATTLVTGRSSYAGTAADSESLATLSGTFVLSGTKTIALQHQCTSTEATYGLGIGVVFSTAMEIFASLELWLE